MEILFSSKEDEYDINFEKNCVIFGSNNSGKTKVLKLLSDSIKNGNVVINSLNCQKNEYDVIFFSEESDFNDEFSFTKSNLFKATIYDSIMNSINKEQLLKEVNSTFDKIDSRVNDYLDKNMNQFFDNKIKFDIDITDLDNIINKFTSVYINDLNDNKKIPKSFKRILLYQLSLLNFNDNKEKFIIIDDFDLYMDSDNIIKILNFVSKYSSDNCHFILSTSNPIVYTYLPKEFDVYKINKQRLYKLSDLNYIIKRSIIGKEYQNNHELISFEDFYNKNVHLINEKDIDDFYKKNFVFQKTNIGIILTSDYIYFNKYNSVGSYIITRNSEEIHFLKFICDELLTEYEIIDIL